MSEDRLNRLIDVASALASERDVPELLARILDAVVELTGAERGFVVVRENGAWRPAAARNIGEQEAAGARERFSRTILERLLAQKRPLLLQDGDLPAAESIQEEKVRAVCAVPLGDSGAVYLDHRKPGAFRPGDLDLVGAFAGLAAVTLENARLAASLSTRVEAQARELADARADLSRRNRFERMIGGSGAMNGLYRSLEKAAASPYPVLLQGESGTGKELAARAIHNLGARRDGPFIAANCGALSESLLPSELFGHVAGAFTGATATRAGLFELADGGTLFLDEIGTMSAEMQESLLRALEEGEIRRVGSSRTTPVDVRVIAASNVDLAVLADCGEFRGDLFYRLNVLAIELPPLRQRRDDVPVLAEHFLDLAAAELGTPRRGLTPKAVERLQEHPWPGNVRELENAIRRAVTMSESDILDAADFGFLRARPPAGAPCEIVHLDDYIRRVLKAHGKDLDLQEIADRLGISRKTLWEKKRKWGLPQ